MHRPVDRATLSTGRGAGRDGLPVAWRHGGSGHLGEETRPPVPASGERHGGASHPGRGSAGRDRGRRACRAGCRLARDGAADSVSEGLKAIAIATLESVCSDANAPAAARAAASRTLLEMMGLIGRLQAPEATRETPLSEMTASQIDSELERLARVVNGGAGPASGPAPARVRRRPRAKRAVPYDLI